MRKQIIFVTANHRQQSGIGKLTPSVFYAHMKRAAEERGFSFRLHRHPWQFILGPRFKKAGVIVPIYNEERDHQLAAAKRIEWRIRLSYPDVLVVHPTEKGRIVGDKKAVNALLTHHGVPMPEMANGADRATYPILSNTPRGSQDPIHILADGAALDAARYNARLIDTIHTYAGRSYYVCLRAMCVGGTAVSLFVRARPVEDGSPSVHAKDTPRDPALLNYLHETLIEARRSDLENLCRQIGGVLGFGFYAHDILPEAGTGRLYLCETGYKFDDGTIREHLAPIRKQISFWREISGDAVTETAHAFLDHLVDRAGNTVVTTAAAQSQLPHGHERGLIAG